MPKIKTSTSVPVAADKVWEAIGKFNALQDWHPAVEKSELVEGGTVRRVRLLNGGEVVEKLEAHDDDERTYTYSIVSSPLPVINYTSTIKVTPGADGGAEIEWEGNFEASAGDMSDASKMVQDIYQAGLDSLKKMFGG